MMRQITCNGAVVIARRRYVQLFLDFDVMIFANNSLIEVSVIYRSTQWLRELLWNSRKRCRNVGWTVSWREVAQTNLPSRSWKRALSPAYTLSFRSLIVNNTLLLRFPSFILILFYTSFSVLFHQSLSLCTRSILSFLLFFYSQSRVFRDGTIWSWSNRNRHDQSSSTMWDAPTRSLIPLD